MTTLDTNVNTNVYSVQIDDRSYTTNDPVVTGQQLLDLAGKRPTDEFIIFQLLHDGQLEDIRLDETVDLRRSGIEQFLTFKSDRSFRFVIDGRRFEWGAPIITGLKLKQLAGVDPVTYDVWLEIRGVRGAEDRPIADNEQVDLSQPGVERFFTGKKTTTEGTQTSFLPASDRQYLQGRDLSFEEVTDGGQKGILLRGFQLPPNTYNTPQADILILLPTGYPDVPPDMFYLLPWVKLVQTVQYPRAADQPFTFLGQNWQRWSRHNNEWRSGIDGIQTMLKRIEYALEVAA